MNDINTRLYSKVSVKESNISGEGLFADEDIKQGQIILSFGGILCLQEDRYSDKVLRSTCVGVTENINLCELASNNKDISDYINHSCSPNAGMLDSITIVAIKPIKKEEEILCDYAFWEGNIEWVMKHNCNCKSSNCRTVIDGKYWQQIKSTDEMFKYFSPFIKRRILNHGKN